MFKALLDLMGRKAQDRFNGDADVDGNQERPLPQRWRDPAPKPERQFHFGQRAH